MEHHFKCELIGGEPPTLINTFSNLFIVAAHHTYLYTTQVMSCCTADCRTRCPLQNNQHIPYLVAIVNCTYIGSATTPFKDLVTLHKRSNRKYFGRGSAIVSFGHGNSRPVSKNSPNQIIELSEGHSSCL